VRVERIVLKHHRDVAVLRRQVGHVLTTDGDCAGGDILQSGHEPQHGRLAAAGRTYEYHELAVRDLKTHVVDGHRASGEHLAHPAMVTSLL